MADDEASEPSDGASTDALLREIARVDDDGDTAPRSGRLIGSRLGRFVLRSEIGRGGMGVVYRAHDESLGRSVALKVLPEGREGDHERRGRFLREARSAAAIIHPNVATIFETGEADGCLFIAMELVGGESLRARFVKGRPLPAAEVIHIAKGITRGLEAAHAQGIVHRDLKPENVMCDARGEPKILDFGLAKLRHAEEAPRDVLERQPTDAVSTEQGRLMGTPSYMSPEQAAGKPLDARSDLFSLGIVLYEALTGGRPFKGDTSFEIMASVMLQTPLPLGTVNPDVPAPLAALVMKCLEKLPRDRPASAAALLESLEALSVPGATPTPSRPRWPLAAAAIVAIVGALLLMRARSSTPTPAALAKEPTIPSMLVGSTPPAAATAASSASGAAPIVAPASATAATSVASSVADGQPSASAHVGSRASQPLSNERAPSVRASASTAASTQSKPRARDPLGDQN